MKALKILVVITALVVVVGVVSDAWAGCAPARLFRSQGKPNNTANINFDPTGTDASGNQIGRLWDSDDANNSNNFTPGQCPAANFWILNTNGTYKIDAYHGSAECNPTGCPADNMTVVVEDYAAGGPPGINSTAFYLAFMVLETPANDRWWDYGLIDGLPTGTTLAMVEFPSVDITGSSRTDANIQVNYNNTPQETNVHTWAESTEYPTNRVISEWQLVKATGLGDPGRARSNGWVTIQTTPYDPLGPAAQFLVPCSDTNTDEYIAIGIGFNGGAAGVIDSALVGPATQLECDPNLAQPDHPVNVDRKPSATQIESKTGRSGGRR
jgi:hypothetical protein